MYFNYKIRLLSSRCFNINTAVYVRTLYKHAPPTDAINYTRAITESLYVNTINL